MPSLFNDTIDQNIQNDLKQIEMFFLNMLKPMNFNSIDSENCLVSMDNNLEHLCSLLESNGATNAKNLSVSEFYGRLKYYKSLNAKK